MTEEAKALDRKRAEQTLLEAETLKEQRRAIRGEKTLGDLRKESRRQIVVLFVSMVLAAVVPLLLWDFAFAEKYTEALLSFSLIATPLVTFFGFIWIGEYLQRIEPTFGVVRTALTASISSLELAPFKI